ncbi:MAG: NAD(P)H-dependent oxidoreductase [Nostoc sp.]|uniref:NADPH-dependent FMN reductase n=1 Tax=Nostoc sp. TaxID=1180 RepID=UPI002FFC85F5
MSRRKTESVFIGLLTDRIAAGIVCYSAGSFGGVRAAIQLRAFLSEIEMPTISSIFAISKIGNSLDEAGATQESVRYN